MTTLSEIETLKQYDKVILRFIYSMKHNVKIKRNIAS